MVQVEEEILARFENSPISLKNPTSHTPLKMGDVDWIEDNTKKKIFCGSLVKFKEQCQVGMTIFAHTK